MRCNWLIAFFVLEVFGANILGAATQSATDKSLFLVARRELSDLLFKQTVVLMLPGTGTELVAGLIVNKPTRVQLRDVFPKDPALKSRTDTVYFGGPVDIRQPGVLFSATKALEPARHLSGDLYVSFDPDFIEDILVTPKEEVKAVRLFLGRAQWARGQLREEFLRGAWYGELEENSWIFRSDAENVWTVLVGRLEAGAPI